MKTRTAVIALSFLFAAACGGTVDHKASQPAANANSAPANVPPEFSGAPVNGAAPPADLAVNGAVKPPTKAGIAPKTFQFPEKDGPAPDDSDIKTTLGENLVQTRTFHNNPQIAKVEKTTAFVNGQPRSSYKVYLKNGQVKDAALKELSAPADDILKAIR
jgi:hypothetical protein